MQLNTYTSQVPGTLDLAERCLLALQGVANTSDPNNDHLFWFELYWNSKTPFMVHSGCDIECGFKTLDNFFQLRHASGCESYQEREKGLLEFLLSCVENDGLFWSRYSDKRPWHMGAYSRNSKYVNKPVDLAGPYSTGGLMAVLADRNNCPEEKGYYDDIIRSMARGLEKIAIKRDDYAYYPDCKIGHPFWMPRGGWPDDTEPADEHESGEGTVVSYVGHQILGLSKWAAQSGDEESLDFARKLVRFGMKKKFWGHPGDPDRVAGYEQGHVDSHFHCRCHFLKGLLEYGLIADDRNAIDFVRSSYEHMRTWGISRIGFIPTWVNGSRISMETCLLGDLVEMTIKMSECGIGDYWEDVDRIIRNHLVESQITNRNILDVIQQHTSVQSENPAEEQDTTNLPLTSTPTMLGGEPLQLKAIDPRQVCTDSVLDRCVGTFTSYLLPDSALNWRTMSCCNANGSRGLYYAWEAITRCAGKYGQVNLLLNRAAPWLDVESYLPYEGKVIIRNKTCRGISVRIPAWVRIENVHLKINDKNCVKSFAGRYMVANELKAGDILTIDFPIIEETFYRTAHAKTKNETLYCIKVRGNTVVDISPRDKDPIHYPFYIRDYLKQDHPTPIQNVTRNVSVYVPSSVV